jgi:hypothetical protein
LTGSLLAILRPVDAVHASSDRKSQGEESPEADGAAAPSMAVSIAGVSTACSKDALVSSAKAVREALSTD